MSLPQYQILVLNPNSGAVSIVFDGQIFYDLRYSRLLNDIGTIAFTLPSTADIRSVFTLDSFIEVYRSDANGDLQLEETYLTRLTHRFIEGDEERFVVGGVSLNHLLTRRIIDPDDDPQVAGGFSTKSGKSDQVIYDYCNEQIGPGASVGRSIPQLTIAAVSSVGLSVGQRLRHENLFKVVKDLSKIGAIDFQIRRGSGNSMVLTIGVIGSDKTRSTNEPLGQPWVGLTPFRGNLTLPSLQVDRKEEGNFVYALGQGQRDRRIVRKSSGVGITDSLFNRMEFAEDIRNIERSDVQGLISGADVALTNRIVKREFTYQPTGTEPGNVYHEDWDVGDAVTTAWNEDELNLRIIGVEVSIGADGETITSTVTDDFVFPGSKADPGLTVYGELPTRAVCWHAQSTAIVGAAVSTAVIAGQIHNFQSLQNPGANGDAFTNSAFLRRGTYIVSVVGVTFSDGGKLDWYINNVLVASGFDYYSAAVGLNFISTFNIVINYDGYVTLKGVVNGRNASSVGFLIRLTKMCFKQLSD